MLKQLIALALLAFCSSDGGGPSVTHAEEKRKAAPARQAGSTLPATLVGLYENDQSGALSQICVVERGGETRFGLLLWGANDHSCSGSGIVERGSGRIALAMAGDSPCRLEAELDDGQLTIAQEQPAGCAYYCGARARMAGTRFTQTGKTEADARRARDLVGEPLCTR